MTKTAAGDSLTWVHVGDLHITDQDQSNYRDFLSIIDEISTHLADDIDFCVLPGDNADIVVATPGFRPPDRTADGSDADAVGARPERHLLGTHLGPNRNGRQW